MMEKVKILFKFHFNNESTMSVGHIGEGDTTEAAITSAWQNMSEKEFGLKLILKTKKIEVIAVEPIDETLTN